MKKVVKLTESDLNRIVKRVMNEGSVVVGYLKDMPEEGLKGTWSVKNGTLTLHDAQNQVIKAYSQEGLQ